MTSAASHTIESDNRTPRTAVLDVVLSTVSADLPPEAVEWVEDSAVHTVDRAALLADPLDDFYGGTLAVVDL